MRIGGQFRPGFRACCRPIWLWRFPEVGSADYPDYLLGLSGPPGPLCASPVLSTPWDKLRGCTLSWGDSGTTSGLRRAGSFPLAVGALPVAGVRRVPAIMVLPLASEGCRGVVGSLSVLYCPEGYPSDYPSGESMKDSNCETNMDRS